MATALLILAAASSPAGDALIQGQMEVLAVLLGGLALLFLAQGHRRAGKIFKVVPLLVFAYFVPTILSNAGVIPTASPLYEFVIQWLLPASLFLLILPVDLPAVAGLGRPALIMFFTATASVIVGGPVAYWLLKGLVPPSLADEAWKGLSAMAGSWIGGSANFVAIGASVGAKSSTLAMFVVIDVAIANVWMAILLFFAGRENAMDQKLGADRTAIDHLRQRIETFQAEVARPATVTDLMLLIALALGVTAIGHGLAQVLTPWTSRHLPLLANVISSFTWVVTIVTTLALALSFTPLRRLEGAGASKLGSVLLYLLVACIGAQAEFHRVLEAPGLLAIGALWMVIHVAILFLVRRAIRAPIFFAAVGSQANIGGAASAPLVAAAFHPTLAPIGVLLAVVGYALGTYGGLLCAWILAMI
jgi:uncharacterized membrane protein